MPGDEATVEEGSSTSKAHPATGELSCVSCRSRKLRCDRMRPNCTRCAKAGSDCVYPESRRKPAFKRKNVRQLEERLAQVEVLLQRAGEGASTPHGNAPVETEGDVVKTTIGFDIPVAETVFFQGVDYGANLLETDTFPFTSDMAGEFPELSTGLPDNDPMNTAFGRELMELGGITEPLPPFEVMEDLNRLFFQRQQQFAPVIHPARYLHSFYSAPHMKPPMCLQYAIWALSSNGEPKYQPYHDVFYQRARKYAESDEMKGYGEHFITVAHAQAWFCIATDEARSMLFTRAAMSCARAVRLVEMMGLHQLDSPPTESSPTLAPPRDWVELEERRRLFWGVFCIDSHCSISTGWPHLIDASIVTTHLPSSESAFHSGEPMETCNIHDVLNGHSYTSFAGAAIICHLFNQILKHVHRPKPGDNPENYEYGDYWKRHRDLDNTLSSAFMFLPESFQIPQCYRDPTAVHTNMNLHASVICLHQAALEKIETYSLPDSAKKSSQDRLVSAAQEIINIMKLTSHVGAHPKTPLAALSLYCAASVYIYFCKESQAPSYVDNLNFILSAMAAIGRTHNLTRSFLRQALLDVEFNDLRSSVSISQYDKTLKDLGSGLSHTIPLLARSRITRHSGAQPPLPGRLPLGNPIGNVLPDEPQRPPAHWSFVPTHNPKPSLGCVSGSHLNKRRRAEAETTGGYTRRDVLLWDASATNPSHSPQQGELNFTTMDTGSTIKPNVLAHGSPKPFPAAAREPVSHSPGKEIPGSWNLAGVDINALAQDQGHHESFGGFDFADPEDPNIDWSAFQPPGNADIGG